MSSARVLSEIALDPDSLDLVDGGNWVCGPLEALGWFGAGAAVSGAISGNPGVATVWGLGTMAWNCIETNDWAAHRRRYGEASPAPEASQLASVAAEPVSTASDFGAQSPEAAMTPSEFDLG